MFKATHLTPHYKIVKENDLAVIEKAGASESYNVFTKRRNGQRDFYLCSYSRQRAEERFIEACKSAQVERSINQY